MFDGIAMEMIIMYYEDMNFCIKLQLNIEFFY